MIKEDTEPTLRAFVALSLDDAVMDQLRQKSIALQNQFAAFNIKWVPFKNYHLTLIFIGNVPLDEVDKMEVLIKEAVVGVKPFDIDVGDVTLFPPDQEKKGVLIASVKANKALTALQSRLEAIFRAAGYDLINRPYRPHITLARLRKSKVEQEELLKYDEVINSPVTGVHIYETHKQDGVVFNSIVRSVDL